VIDAIDHGGCLVQQLDLVDVLYLAGVQHDLLAVDDVEPCLLELKEHGRFGVIETDRHVSDARLLDQVGDFFGIALHQAE